MSDLLREARQAIRWLMRQPGFTAVAVLTLSLGIGANTAIFSVVHAVLLQTLPIREPERLVLFDDYPSEGTMSGDAVVGRWEYFSFPAYERFRDRVSSFQGVAAFRSGHSRVSVVGESGSEGGQAQLAEGHLVSGNYFEVLGARPLLGRTLTPADDSAGASPAAVVSYGYWKTRLGGDPAVLDRSLTLNGTAVTIVGVMPPAFFGVRVQRAPDFWLPLRLQPAIELTAAFATDPTIYWLDVIGRLRPGATLAEAQAGTNRTLREYLTELAGTELSPERRSGIEQTYVKLVPGARGISRLRAQYSRTLYVLAGVVALVLLIACANVANLLLARAASRKAEIAVRLALGASAGRLWRQLLIEGLLLALAGGAAGVLLADWGVHLLVSRVSPSSPLDVGVSPLVLAFTAGVSVAAGLIFSLAPAMRSARLDLGAVLKERSQSGGARARLGVASALVAGQVALSLVLLVGAGLLTRSLANMLAQDLGFDPQGVLAVRIDPRLAGYRPAELSDLYRRLTDRLNTVPGVQAVTVASYSPLGGLSRTNTVTVQSYSPREGEDMGVGVNLVGPRYPEVLGLSLRSGRAIEAGDGPDAPGVAMVNEAFARAFFPGANPIGRRFDFGGGNDRASNAGYEIVGVMPDVRFAGIGEPAGRMVYLPIQQGREEAFTSELEIRTSGDPLSAVARVRAAIAEVDSRLPIVRVASLEQQVGDSLRQPRLFARLVGFFGVLAMILACVGLYGVVAQSVARRSSEVGIRMALGAAPGGIVRMVLRETATLTCLGLLVGVPVALAASQLIRSQLFGVAAHDPLTLAATVALLLLVALVAGAVPAWRAARVDPMAALRAE